MNERIFIDHLHNRRQGMDLYAASIPTETSYLAPDGPISGRFVDASGRSLEIACR